MRPVWLVRSADTHMAGTETDAYAELDDEGAETSVVNAPQDPKKDSNADEQVCFYHTQQVPTGEDYYGGIDNFGNAVDPKGGCTQRKRKLRNLPETPSWANAPHTLPVQPHSYAGMAALAISRSDAPLLLPQSSTEVDPKVVETVLAELSLAPKSTRRPLPIATFPQTRIFQDGHSAAHTLTVLQIASELTALFRAEACELNNAANGTPSPDGSLAPRSIAITVLSTSPSPTLTPNQIHLLDAAAFLAAEESTDDDNEHAVGKGVCAASQLRMAFLHGECAKAYAMKRYASEGIEFVVYGKSETPRVPGNEVCMTWLEDVPIEDVGDGSMHRVTRSEFVTLPHADTAQAYVDGLREAIFKQWRDNNLIPSTPMRLLGSYSNCRYPPENAYARHRLACTRAFWKHLEPCLEPELSSYVTDDPRYSGSLEWTHMFAKVVPRTTAMDDPNTSHGIIVHQHGFGTQAREFIERVRHEEEEQHAKPPIGLRGPVDTTEEANCMHILLTNAEECHLAPHLTCFALRSVAGESFGRSLPKLTWRLVPLTNALKESVFILPCEKVSIFNARHETNDPLAQSTDRAVYAYAHLFTKMFSSGVMTDSAVSTLPDIVTRDPTPREEAIKTLLGLPLTCKAFRIGDVANALQSLTSNSAPEAEIPSCLSSFFMSAAASLGSEKSVEDAFMWASTNAERVVVSQERAKRLSGRVEELELALKVAKAISSPTPEDTPAGEETTTGAADPETATSDPPPPAASANPTELDAERLANLLRSWNRSADFSGALCYTLKAPIQGKSTRMVLASLSAAAPEVDASVQQATYEWSKTHCCKKTMGDCDRIARTCHRALSLAGKAAGDHRRAFLACTSKTADAVTTIIDIDLDKPTGEDCWKTIDWTSDDGWGCSTEVARRAVVLAWFADERGLAVLPVSDVAEDEDDAQ